MRKALIGGLLALTLAALFVSTRQYLGFHAYNRYLRLRTEAHSIQRDFPLLESALLQAARRYENPLFYKELGRLYLERAEAEDKFGDPALRDSFLDRAAEAIAANIRHNPVDSWAYFEMGKLWMLYNAPLLTYAAKGRAYLRRALDLNPTHAFLNLNVLYFHLTQWDFLDEAEKRFVWERLERKWQETGAFIGQLRSQWVENVKTDEGLRAILMSNPLLWAKIKANFQ